MNEIVKYKLKEGITLEKSWVHSYLKNAIHEYSSYFKIKFLSDNYKEKVKQIVNEESKLKRKGYYLSLGFADQNCNLCKKCVRPICCNNPLSRPNWNHFPELKKKYNLKKNEGIILIAPDKHNQHKKSILLKRFNFFDYVEKKFNIKLYCIETKDIKVGWSPVAQCLYGCKNCSEFSRRYSCPPFAPTPDEIKNKCEKLRYALIINTTMRVPLFNIPWHGFNPIRDIFQKLWSNYHFRRINKIGFFIEKLLKRKKFHFYALGVPCHKCIKCYFPKKCKFPTKIRFVVEACGIDAYDIAIKIGIPIEIPPKNKVNLFQIILFNKLN